MPTPKRSTKKAIPRFRSAAAERAFWTTTDSTPYVDWTRAVPHRFPHLTPTSTSTTTTISVRVPNALVMDLQVLARERDVPYQSLLILFLTERVAVERGRRQPRRERPGT